MTRLRVLALLCLVGCGRSGALAESDLAKLRPGWALKDVLKAFGEGTRTELPIVFYRVWVSDDEYPFAFESDIKSRLLEVRRVNAKTGRDLRVWPPP